MMPRIRPPSVDFRAAPLRLNPFNYNHRISNWHVVNAMSVQKGRRDASARYRSLNSRRASSWDAPILTKSGRKTKRYYKQRPDKHVHGQTGQIVVKKRESRHDLSINVHFYDPGRSHMLPHATLFLLPYERLKSVWAARAGRFWNNFRLRRRDASRLWSPLLIIRTKYSPVARHFYDRDKINFTCSEFI